jgi:hypothetical protein
MDDDENSLLRYLIEVDTPNYELINVEDEEVHAMVAALDVQRSLENVLMERLGTSIIILLKILFTSPNNSVEGRVSGITK